MNGIWKKLVDHIVPSAGNEYRPHMLGKKWLIFFLAIVLTTEGVLVADLLARGSALNYLAAVLPGEVIALTNTQREESSLTDVQENSLLDAAAQAKAEDMAAKGYFSHVGPDGKEPWAWVSDAGYRYQYAGENLAVRFDNSSDVVNAWMASPSHRANIVKPVYTDIGVGVAQGFYKGAPATFVVQYFGTPQTAAAQSAAMPVATAPQQQESETASTAPEVAGTTTAVAGEPGGTAIAPRQGEPTVQSIAKQFLRFSEAPQGSVFWILSGVVSFIVLALALAFFVHMEIQSTEMLAGGVVVAAIAVAFLALNAYLPFDLSSSQSATVRLFVPPKVLVADEAASTTYADFTVQQMPPSAEF